MIKKVHLDINRSGLISRATVEYPDTLSSADNLELFLRRLGSILEYADKPVWDIKVSFEEEPKVPEPKPEQDITKVELIFERVYDKSPFHHVFVSVDIDKNNFQKSLCDVLDTIISGFGALNSYYLHRGDENE